jgi:hypothetical protein
MNASELVTSLSEQGIRIWADHEKLNIRSPKGLVTPAVQAELAAHKAEILTLLKQKQAVSNGPTLPKAAGLSLSTIGRLIGGVEQQGAAKVKPPVIDSKTMARQVCVTFRPLPKGYQNQTVLQFRQQLEDHLKEEGVQVEPWHEATRPFSYTVKVPWTQWEVPIQTRVIKTTVNAVIDVEGSPSIRSRSENAAAELIYWIYSSFLAKNKHISIPRIAKLIGWSENNIAKNIEDPNRTQVITLTCLNPEFIDPQTSYQKKIKIGINALMRTFSEIIIGVSEDKISILNMNLSDSIFRKEEIDHFVLKSLIPKIFVPIAPLLLNQFVLGQYDPYASEYSARLVELGQSLGSTGLFPPGFKLSEIIKRKSHRDIVDTIVNGRTGVSYGFIAYIEAPQYVGELELNAEQWQRLAPIAGFPDQEVRQNDLGRRYIRLEMGAHTLYKQIPDLWIVSARSGSDKTHLDLGQDVLRIGLQNQLVLQLPQGINPEMVDIKPSYDTYVMVAIALSAALYVPELVKNGAPIVHFHGYPSADWFKEREYWTGANNPSVPCGTYESGVFNFLGIASLSEIPSKTIDLISLIEPDHGTNVIAPDMAYLIQRLKAGCKQGQVQLGGKNFRSL